MQIGVNGKITFKGTKGCASLFQGSFKGRWPSGDNLFCLQSQLCSFPLQFMVQQGVWLSLSYLICHWQDPFITALTFLGKKEIFAGLCQPEEPAPPPAFSRVRLVMHPLCKELMEDVICNALEGIRLFLEYPGRVLPCSSAPPTDMFLSQVHVHLTHRNWIS